MFENMMKPNKLIYSIALLVKIANGEGELTMWTDSPTTVESSSCEYAIADPWAIGNTQPWLEPYVTTGMYTAVSADLFLNGKACGKCYEINYVGSADTNTEGSTFSGSAVVQVVDSGAGGSQHFDLYVTPFEQITGTNTGVFTMESPSSYTEVDCVGTVGATVVINENNNYYQKILVVGGVTGVDAVTMRVGTSSFVMTKSSGATWVASSLGGAQGAVEFDVTFDDGTLVQVANCFSGAWPVAPGSTCSASGSSDENTTGGDVDEDTTGGDADVSGAPSVSLIATNQPSFSPNSIEPSVSLIATNQPSFSPNSIEPVECFSPYAKTNVLGKGRVMMKDLIVGDKVLTASGEHKTLFSIDHYSSLKLTKYVQIYTDQYKLSEQPLELTQNHLLFKEGKDYPVPASTIKVGDNILSMHHGPTKVVDIKSITRKGLYNPLTMDGTIVVDGIIASTYNSLSGESHMNVGKSNVISFHDVVDLACVPYRMFCSTVGLGICNFHEEHAQTDMFLMMLFKFWSKTRNNLMKQMYLHLYIITFGILGTLMYSVSWIMAVSIFAILLLYRRSKKKNYKQKS